MTRTPMFSTNSQQCDFSLKILVMGAKSSGKTSIVSRFVDDAYTESYAVTETGYKTRGLSVLGKNINLTVYDDKGNWNETFRNFNIFQGIKLVVHIVDLTQSEDFLVQDMRAAANCIDKYSTDPQLIHIVMASKSDAIANSAEKLASIVEKTQLTTVSLFACVSAKYGRGIDDTFQKAIEMHLVKNCGVSATRYQQKVEQKITGATAKRNEDKTKKCAIM